jgi:hypothetical protein
MTHLRIPILLGTHLVGIALLLASGASWGYPQNPPPDGKKDQPEKETPATDAEKETRRVSEQLISGIDLEILTDDKWIKVKRIEKPLLLYGDYTRENDRGSLWGWGEKGRPVALLELFQDTSNRTKWIFCISNTSGRTLRATRGGVPWWKENDSDVELKSLPQAPTPAADAMQRQRQVRLLAQKFSGHEFWNPNNSRYELRRIERPLYTYRDEASGVLEGALFTFANGTNPEIMLFVEARVDPKDKSQASWHYVVGRSSDAELRLEYSGNEVFKAPRSDLPSDPEKPYWGGKLNTISELQRDK